jgi:hypothetical protein
VPRRAVGQKGADQTPPGRTSPPAWRRVPATREKIMGKHTGRSLAETDVRALRLDALGHFK